MILNAGKLNAEQLLAGNASGKKVFKIGFGTGTSPVTGTEIALTGAVIKDITAVVYQSNNIVEFQSSLVGSDPEMTINEMGLYNEDNVLIHRKLITPKEKVAGVTYAAGYRVKIV